MSMRIVDLSRPAPSAGDPARLARLTRHLEARLNDFGPAGPEVRSANQETGLVLAFFPGRSPGALADILARRFGIASIPTILVFKTGELSKTSIGYCSKEELLSLL